MKSVFNSVILGLLAVSLAGCAAIDPYYRKPEHVGPLEETYLQSFEKVWRAAQLALANYNVRVNNIDTGTLETFRVKNPYLWKPAWEEKKRFSSGYGYILRLQVVRSESGRRPSTTVIVEKVIEEKRNYIDVPRQLPSDGFEEQEILYRIDRELIIEAAIERQIKKENSFF